MSNALAAAIQPTADSYIDELMDRMQVMYTQHRLDNPDLYLIVDREKEKALEKENAKITVKESGLLTIKLKPTEEFRGAELREKIRAGQATIRQELLAVDAAIIPRTQAHNRKCTAQSIEEETEYRAKLMSSQIQAWRSMLPSLIKKFSKITDYRRVSHVKHKITVLMVFGLFAFIFRLSSRREMNRELTSPVIFNHLKKLWLFAVLCRIAI